MQKCPFRRWLRAPGSVSDGLLREAEVTEGAGAKVGRRLPGPVTDRHPEHGRSPRSAARQGGS